MWILFLVHLELGNNSIGCELVVQNLRTASMLYLVRLEKHIKGTASDLPIHQGDLPHPSSLSNLGGRMEHTFVSLFLSLVFLQLCLKSQSQLVPSLHIFGDSAVDVGNNLYLNTSFRPDFAPYGVDFLIGQSGRFSNGATMADVLGIQIGK